MSAQKSYLPVKYLDDDIVLSESEAWTYVRLPNVSYEFITDEERLMLMDQTTMALANLTTASQEELDIHIRTIHRPFPEYNWFKKLKKRVDEYGPAPGWEGYSDVMYERVHQIGFQQKKTYLGVKLGDRSKSGQVESKSKDILSELVAPLKKIVGFAEQKAGFEDYEVSHDEVEHWKGKAKEYRRSLKESHFKAEPASAEEIAWVIASPLWPEFPQPEPSYSDSTTWGEGELVQLVEGLVVNKHKWLEVEQVIIDEELENATESKGYVAFLSVSRFPDSLFFPQQNPWIYMAESSFSFPVDFSIRLSIVPPAKVKKDVSRKLADARDQAQHIAETGAGVPLNVREQVETATTLEYLIDKERMPWAYSRIRLMITAPTEEELKARCKRIIEEYRELSIDVAWPSGDQFNLLLEATPGSKVKVPSYYQRQDLAVIAGGMPNASSEVGDAIVDGAGWLGPYIGWTSSGSLSPVMFSANSSIARNHPPGVAIIGSPGGGKALSLDTPILTNNGWKTMGSLTLNDKVYGADGELCNIVEKSEVMTERPCYVVEFRDGSEVIADADHEWLVNVQPFSHADNYTSENNGDGGLDSYGEFSQTGEVFSSLNPEELPFVNEEELPHFKKSQKLTTAELFQMQVFHGENSEPVWFDGLRKPKDNTGGLFKKKTTKSRKNKQPLRVRCEIPTTEPLKSSPFEKGKDSKGNLASVKTSESSPGDPNLFALFKKQKSNTREEKTANQLLYEVYGSDLVGFFETMYLTGRAIIENSNDGEHLHSVEGLEEGQEINIPPTADVSFTEPGNASFEKVEVLEKVLSSPVLDNEDIIDKNDNVARNATSLVSSLKNEQQSVYDFLEKVITHGDIFSKTALLQGIIDASNTNEGEVFNATFGTGDQQNENLYYEGLVFVPNEDLLEPLLYLFSSLGYITQIGSNGEEKFISEFIKDKQRKMKKQQLLSELEETLELEPDTEEGHEGEKRVGCFITYSYRAPHEIISIKPTESVPVQCIQVDGPKNLYLAGEKLIPTHNSFLAFKLAYDMAMQGVWTIYIDPKADAKPMGELKGLGDAKVFDLRHGNDGMLDPFTIGETLQQSKLLALETLRLLLGSFSEEREEVLAQKVAEVSAMPNPSLSKVVDLLKNDKKSIARNLGVTLDLIRDLEFARLCFSPSAGSPLKPEDGLTVVTLLGLDLPDFSTAPSDYSYENKLAVAVMHLLTRYARKLMLSLDKSHPKAICIDEAWAITSTPQGAKLVPEIARMGRSHNTALVLVSQNAGDLMAQAVTNSISTRFAFRSKNNDEIRDVLSLMGIEDPEYAAAVRSLNKGECLMQDAEGRISRVVVDVKDWNPEMFKAFDTNPETRGKDKD